MSRDHPISSSNRDQEGRIRNNSVTLRYLFKLPSTKTSFLPPVQKQSVNVFIKVKMKIFTVSLTRWVT